MANQFTIAYGKGTVATGIATTAVGCNTQANGNSSFAYGTNCVVQGDGSYAGGNSVVVKGNGTLAHGENIKAFNSNIVAFGKDVQVGLNGWYYVAVDFAGKTFYLSAQQPTNGESIVTSGNFDAFYDEQFNSGLAAGDVISFVNNTKLENAATIAAVDGNKITFQENPFSSIIFVAGELDPDDYSMYCIAKPDIDASDIGFGQFSFACGRGTKALNKWSYAEGRETLAYGQYAHAEGRQTQAAYASHAEGKGSKADGQYAHAQGQDTVAGGLYSHAGGRQAQALGDGSFAHGNECSAIGRSSVAIGGIYEGAVGGKATGIGAFAFGPRANAKDDCSFVWNGISSVQRSSRGEGSFSIYPKDGIDGFYIAGQCLTSVISGAIYEKVDKIRGEAILSSSAILAYGNETSALGNHSIAIGDRSLAKGGKTITFGNGCSAMGNFDIAIGENAYVQSDKAFAFGNAASATNAFSYSFGKSTYAGGRCSLAFGEECSASSQYAASIGYKNAAYGSKSFAIGNETSAGNGAISFGNTSLAAATYSVAGGSSVSVLDSSEYSIAVGSSNKICGSSALSSGVRKSFIAGTNNTVKHVESNSKYPENIFVTGNSNNVSLSASAKNIFVGGQENEINVNANSNSLVYGVKNCLSAAGMSIVEGEMLSAQRPYSCMFGRNAVSTADKQFIWSAGANNYPTYVPVASGGTFNINPLNGIKGFYIGNDNFVQCVLSAVQMMTSAQKQALKSALEAS